MRRTLLSLLNQSLLTLPQLLTNGSDYKTWTRWGRVGEHGQSALLGSGSFADALKNFEKKFKDK